MQARQVTSIRLSAAERRLLERAARIAGLSVSALVRDAGLKTATMYVLTHRSAEPEAAR